MKTNRFAAACAALFAALLSITAVGQDESFIGVITDAQVEVRSGAGRAYYVVGELKKGDLVRVQKILFEETWYQITVPTAIHSYVSKAFVNAQGDGETGIINADRTEFKAASTKGPGESYRVQGTLSKNDKVTILGEEGNFYKIVSPTDAAVFIPAGTLRKATEDDLKAAGVDDKATTPQDPKDDKTAEPVKPVPPIKDPETTDPVKPEPVKPDPVKPDPVKPDDTTDPVKPEPVKPDPVKPEPVKPDPVKPVATEDGWPTPPDVQVNTPARSEELKALEMKVLPYFSLPVTEQPLDKIAQAYQDLLKTEGLPSVDQQIIEVRLRTVERRQEILDTIKRAEQAGKTDHARTVVPAESEEDKLPVRYTAVGLLQPSSVYDGQSLPLLYRIVDAAPSGRTLAYVAPSDEINIAGMLNQLVGVVGQTNYDRALKLNIIEIERADLLEAEKTEDKE